MTTIPQSGIGIAGYATDTLTEAELFNGKAPTVSTSETMVDQGADLPAYAVVGRITASGKITLSNPGAADGSQNPIGITVVEAKRNGTNDVRLSIWRDGYFNPDLLHWHAGWASDAAKRLAFEAKQPTIFIRKGAV